MTTLSADPLLAIDSRFQQAFAAELAAWDRVSDPTDCGEADSLSDRRYAAELELCRTRATSIAGLIVQARLMEEYAAESGLYTDDRATALARNITSALIALSN